MTRRERKLEHLKYAAEANLASADFHDVQLVHNCLPETAYTALDLSTTVAGIRLARPFFINAITGGVEAAEDINRSLAEVAKECGFALAVGSQMAALENAEYSRTFSVVREVYPDGVIFANLGAYADADLAAKAVEMVQADALQIHLNVPQELVMPEGDRDFRGYTERIAEIVKALPVPVIVKEVGFGIAKEQAAVIASLGAAAIDVGGKGGTNFIDIESRRARPPQESILKNWGISTPLAILEAKTGAPALDIVASGGINNGLLAAKALALGAKAVGIAGLAAKVLLSEGKEALKRRLQNIVAELKLIMVMTGSPSLVELQKIPVVITGKTGEWMKARELVR
ncbi:MAG: type 2 isopentenyl-diphosphate Delta-isomerase [Firmicutes bacterium]|nr:type 2 isopentenyl-diphosphate Delta-isomerase [Bacillota bacterium]